MDKAKLQPGVSQFARRSAVSRADLLYTLLQLDQQAPEGARKPPSSDPRSTRSGIRQPIPWSLGAVEGAECGFLAQEPSEPAVQIQLPPTPVIERAEGTIAPKFRLPLKLPKVLVAFARQELGPPTAPKDGLKAIPALTPEDIAARHKRTQLEFLPLEPKQRLLPRLRQALARKGRPLLDLRRLIDLVVRGEALNRLPSQRRPRWTGNVLLILDLDNRLRPYWEDLFELHYWLSRALGRAALKTLTCSDGPRGPFIPFGGERSTLPRSSASGRPWQQPPPGTRVLVVSDLGRLGPPHSRLRADWRRFLEGLGHAGLDHWALTPLGPLDGEARTASDSVRGSKELHWGAPPAGPQIVTAGGAGGHSRDPLMEDLLAAVAASRRVGFRQLRRLRLSAPGGRSQPGLEGQLWNHPAIVGNMALRMRQEWPGLQRALNHFQKLPLDWQLRARRLSLQGNAHLDRLLETEEALAWHEAADPDLPRDKSLEADFQAACDLLARLTAKLQQGKLDEALYGFSRGLLLRSNSAKSDQVRKALRELEAVVGHWARQLGQPETSSIALAAHDSLQVPADRVLGQAWIYDLGGVIRFTNHTHRRGICLLSKPISVGSRGINVRTWDVQGRRIVSQSTFPWIPLLDIDYRIPVGPSQALEVGSGFESLWIGFASRPRGVTGLRQHSGSTWATAPSLGPDPGLKEPGKGYKLNWVPKHETGSSLLAPSTPRLDQGEPGTLLLNPRNMNGGEFTLSFKEVDVSVNLEFSGKLGNVVQRLIAIEPGEYLMGSPEGEEGHEEREGPQHRVVISRGFWLADTACTQELWEFVMGENPSGFKGPQRPVDNVSWEDVQRFLRKLKELMPGTKADLPTEAEWEYACRAGTRTPFGLREQITPELVNYDGNHPYAGGKRGAYRQQTVDVKALPANNWGLYQMHGNVWEWCADGQRKYTAEEEVDPRGPEGPGAPRVLRGGSWRWHARRCRSAFRDSLPPSHRGWLGVGGFGFRFSLRSMD